MKPDTYLWNLWKKDILVWRSHNRIQHSLCFLHMRKVAVWLFVYLYGAEADISGYVAMLPMYLSGILRVTWNMWFLFLSWYVLFTRWVDPFTYWDREGFDYFCIFTEDSKAQKSEPANDFCWNLFCRFLCQKKLKLLLGEKIRTQVLSERQIVTGSGGSGIIFWNVEFGMIENSWL